MPCRIAWRQETRSVTALLNAGVLDRVEGAGVAFRYETVKVEFLLRAA